MMVFYNGSEYSDGESLKKPHSKSSSITTIPFPLCTPVILDPIPLDSLSPDLLISQVLRTQKLDLSKSYSFCYSELFDGSILVMACEQSFVKLPSIPKIFLPFGIQDKKILDNAMFCFDDSLCVFHNQKLLYFSKNQDFGDIFNCLENLREKQGIEVTTIYCNQGYEPIAPITKDFSIFGNYPIAALALLTLPQKHLFLKQQTPWYKSQLSLILAGFLGFACLLFILLEIANYRLDELEKSSSQTHFVIQDSSQYHLLALITNLANANRIFFEKLDFVSQEKNFALILRVCFSDPLDFLHWTEKMDALLKTPAIYQDSQKVNSNYRCTWASWVKND